jgi:hypothetical protein
MELVRGTVQGSILGPILYAIYVTPLFDLHNLTNFADMTTSSSLDGIVAYLDLSLIFRGASRPYQVAKGFWTDGQ